MNQNEYIKQFKSVKNFNQNVSLTIKFNLLHDGIAEESILDFQTILLRHLEPKFIPANSIIFGQR